MSALTPARLLRMAESAWRLIPRRRATSPRVISAGKYSRRTSPGCAGLCMLDIGYSPLVIIHIINIHGICLLKPEYQAPVATHRNRIEPRQVFGQLVQLPTVSFHILGPNGMFQSGEL